MFLNLLSGSNHLCNKCLSCVSLVNHGDLIYFPVVVVAVIGVDDDNDDDDVKWSMFTLHTPDCLSAETGHRHKLADGMKTECSWLPVKQVLSRHRQSATICL